MGILMEATERNPEAGCGGAGGARGLPQLFGAGSPLFAGAGDVHAIAINTRETEFGSIIQPVPITLDAYRRLQRAHQAANPAAPNAPDPAKHDTKQTHEVAPPPKKKWIKEYLEEEPKSPVPVAPVPVPRVNGVVRASPPPAPAPAADPPAPPPALLLDFVQEHSRPRTNTGSHGGLATPSPPSAGSGGSGGSGGGRAGTREVHNKLEKNRRAHLKECFELLKRQLPPPQDDKKTSNLSILGSAIRFIQVLRRKERECEHEMERLAREKIAAQQRLAALRRDVPPRAARRRPAPAPAPPDHKPPPPPLCAPEAVSKENDRDESVNGQILGIPISITSTAATTSPPGSLNLSTKLRTRTVPVQISPTTSQVVRTSFARHSTLTLTALAAPPPPAPTHHQVVSGVGGGLVVGGALQLVGGPLRFVTTTARPHGVTTMDNSRIPAENGVVSAPAQPAPAPAVGPAPSGGGVVVGGLPLVVAPQMLHPSLHHKVVESQVVKNGVSVSAAAYLSTALVKPVVVVPPPAPRPEHPAPRAGGLPA